LKYKQSSATDEVDCTHLKRKWSQKVDRATFSTEWKPHISNLCPRETSYARLGWVSECSTKRAVLHDNSLCFITKLFDFISYILYYVYTPISLSLAMYSI
jgi:hypothetical protein